MVNPDIQKWKSIFLDTSVIMNTCLAVRGATDAKAQFTYKLIKFLSDTPADGGIDRIFSISTISIAEIWDKSEGDEKTALRVIRALNTPNTEFVSFDEAIAEHFKSKYHSILSKDELNSFARSCSWPEHDLVNGREWVTRDAMILASSDDRKADVILTLDERTMYPMANRLSIPCALCIKDNFNHNENYFFEYFLKSQSDDE